MVKHSEARRLADLTVAQLERLYPDAHCSLDYSDPLELLIATILSAQCTDDRVNIVTKSLFAKYKSAQAFATAPLDELELAIKSTGFFRNKAKNIKACCQEIVDKHQGKVPQSMEDLVVLAGIGRKTANVVLGNAFGISSGVVVDTHVGRLSQRLGLTAAKDPVKIEQDLMQLVAKDHWIRLSHQLIQHGRKVCLARAPRCEDCTMAEFCPQVGLKKGVKSTVPEKSAKAGRKMRAGRVERKSADPMKSSGRRKVSATARKTRRARG